MREREKKGCPGCSLSWALVTLARWVQGHGQFSGVSPRVADYHFPFKIRQLKSEIFQIQNLLPLWFPYKKKKRYISYIPILSWIPPPNRQIFAEKQLDIQYIKPGLATRGNSNEWRVGQGGSFVNGVASCSLGKLQYRISLPMNEEFSRREGGRSGDVYDTLWKIMW